jgi:histidinol dehydrogenase
VPLERFTLDSWRQSSLSRRRLDLSGLEEQRAAVREIVARVAAEGDSAVAEYEKRFDGWRPGAGEAFAVGTEAMETALRELQPSDRSALELAARRIRDFHESQVYPASVGGDDLQLLTRPVGRAGIYVPGGRAAYPSTVLMGAIPARVAGVREVVVATPPRPDGSVPAPILAAAAIAGADALYRIGGAQAVAALAFGSESIPRVDVLAGPGNVYVTLAKREVFGSVGVDGIAGPTEILIVADRKARPEYVAADLVSQLEHDPMAFAILVTDSNELASAVEREFDAVLPRLDRHEVVAAAHACIVVVDSIEQAIELANDFGPEHLELVVEDAERWLPQTENAGAVFVGPLTAVSFGDYVIGTNHTLPTAGSARFGSPLGVHTFLKRTSVARLDRANFDKLQEAARAIARLEGLTAHAYAVEVRLR